MLTSDYLLVFIACGVATLLVGLGYCFGFYRGVMTQREQDAPLKRGGMPPVLEPGWDKNL